MNISQIVGGMVAGFVGAAIWAAIAYYGNVEIGYIAWGIGVLVGIAVAALGRNSSVAGVVAVVITTLSILGGKYAAVELSVQEMKSEMKAVADGESMEDASDEDLQAFLANGIATKREADGQAIEWPEVNDEEAETSAQYPADLWQEAGDQLANKSDSEKQQLQEEYREYSRKFAEMIQDAVADAVREQGFFASFSPIDFLFFGLAIFSAWGIAARDEDGAEA